MTQNQIAYQANLENKRANLARESEAHRSNVANEEENKRFHKESVAETKRSNLAREGETNRSNLANEMLKATQIAETQRSNKANEDLKDKEIQTRSEDTRYTADLGYQGRVDAAYISKWGVSKSDASSLATTVGGGVAKAAPGAKIIAKAGVAVPARVAAGMITKPLDAARSIRDAAKDAAGKVSSKSNKSTTNGVRRRTAPARTMIGGRKDGKKKF